MANMTHRYLKHERPYRYLHVVAIATSCILRYEKMLLILIWSIFKVLLNVMFCHLLLKDANNNHT